MGDLNDAIELAAHMGGIRGRPGVVRKESRKASFLELFGGNIFLVSQRYHVPVGEPLLLAFWAVGTFPIAYAAASRRAPAASRARTRMRAARATLPV